MPAFLAKPKQLFVSTVADVGLAQFFADGDTYPVGFRAVLSCVQYKITVSDTLAVIQPLKNVIQFQRA